MIEITSSANHVILDMGTLYPSETPIKKAFWRKDQVYYVLQNTNHIEVDAADKTDWAFNFDGNGAGYQVGLVDGVAPTSNADLFDKLVAVLS